MFCLCLALQNKKGAFFKTPFFSTFVFLKGGLFFRTSAGFSPFFYFFESPFFPQVHFFFFAFQSPFFFTSSFFFFWRAVLLGVLFFALQFFFCPWFTYAYYPLLPVCCWLSAIHACFSLFGSCVSLQGSCFFRSSLSVSQYLLYTTRYSLLAAQDSTFDSGSFSLCPMIALPFTRIAARWSSSLTPYYTLFALHC